MAKLICKVLGIGFVLVGIVGFIQPNLLGMHLSTVHSVIHLATGAVALYFGFAATEAAARTFSLAFGAVYFLLGVLGFVAPDLVASVIQAHAVAGTARDLTPDNIVHLILGALFLVGGLMKKSLAATA